MSRTSHTLDCGCRLCVNELLKDIDNLLRENTKLKATMELHAGDCCSLSNEVDMFKEHWDFAEKENDKLRKKLLLSETQNYCKICGNTLDGYIPKEVI